MFEDMPLIAEIAAQLGFPIFVAIYLMKERKSERKRADVREVLLRQTLEKVNLQLGETTEVLEEIEREE